MKVKKLLFHAIPKFKAFFNMEETKLLSEAFLKDLNVSSR